ncbi:MAG: UDP-N-acetylglucosamine 2-epimerase (non-hydrolyzing) [Clostridia bacterium]
MKKIMTVFGTRPEAIKMAPLVLELQKQPENFKVCVVVTAQHREMLDQVLELFQIVPDYDLNIMQAGQSLSEITSRALLGLEKIMQDVRPDIVLVHGDTSTTFAAALAAFYQKIPVGHVEAGLRTGNIYSPYPEEINRSLTGRLASLNFAPTSVAEANLIRENVDPASIFVTGNTVIDALLATVNQAYDLNTIPGLEELDFPHKRVILVTAHRRENWGAPMDRIFGAIRQICESYPAVEIVLPMHKNPLVRKQVYQHLSGLSNIRLIEPLDYQPFVQLMAASYLVMTDSGGMQEEVPALGKPVLVLRDTTERPEALAAGTVRLVGSDQGAIFAATSELLDDEQAYLAMAQAQNPYGDGTACKQIAAILQASRF